MEKQNKKKITEIKKRSYIIVLKYEIYPWVLFLQPDNKELKGECLCFCVYDAG